MRFTIAAAILAQSLPATTSTSSNSDHHVFLGAVGGGDSSPVSQTSSSLFSGTATVLAKAKSGKGRSSKILEVLRQKKEQSGGYLQNIAHRQDAKDTYQECDPESDELDVGVLSCGAGRYCVESDDSNLGGFCVSSPDELDRGLQAGPTLFENLYVNFCADGSPYADGCNCTGADPDSYTLNVACMEEETCDEYVSLCGENVTSCIMYDFAFALTAPLVYTWDRCFEDTEPYSQKTCYQLNRDSDSYECTISVDDVECNSCVVASGLDAYGNNRTCYDFDCTNTVSRRAGSLCEDGVFIAPILYYVRTYGCDYYTCPICGGEDYVSTNPGGTVDVGEGATTCAAINQVALLGGFDETFCQDVVIPGVSEACGCVPFGSTAAPSEVPLTTSSPTAGVASVTTSPTPASDPSDPSVEFTLPPTTMPSALTAGSATYAKTTAAVATLVGISLMSFLQFSW